MSSEDTWNRIHKQYDPIFLVDACALSSSPLKSSLAGPWRRASITWHRRH
nr:hypothetical protein [Bifidobacterium longum]